MKYLKSIEKDMLDRNKFEIGRRVMYAEFVKSFDSTDSIANNLLSFACEESEILSYADIISSVSFDDVVEAFEKSFNENTAVLSVVLPI
jgi:predicted Zn-dependent peptidase